MPQITKKLFMGQAEKKWFYTQFSFIFVLNETSFTYTQYRTGSICKHTLHLQNSLKIFVKDISVHLVFYKLIFFYRLLLNLLDAFHCLKTIQSIFQDTWVKRLRVQ